jgi:superfamily II DNA or RNA helicase
MTLPIQKRDYQERLITKTIDAFTNEGVKSILLEAPTGSGKTITALSALKLLKEMDPSLTFGWVTMRRKLLRQAEKENERVGVKDIDFISMFEKNPPKKDVLVVDEGQHSAANTCLHLHMLMNPKWSLALTATPFRTDKVKLAYEKVISDMGVRYLIENGWLSQFHQYVIPKFTPEEVAKHFLLSPEKWGKSIIYLKTKEECKIVSEILTKAGIKAEIVINDYSEVVREDIYERFEDGATQVLLNVYLLTEGFDAPDLKTVFVKDSAKLPTMQMAGRVLRKDPNNPAKFAQIVQSENTWYPYTRTAKASSQFVWVDDQWLSIDANELVEAVSCAVQQMQLDLPLAASIPMNFGGNLKMNKGKVIYKKRETENSDQFPLL